MGFFKNKHELKLAPGKSTDISIPLPISAKSTEVTIQYVDEFGNEYETKITFDLKNRKVKQEYRVVKKVKELPDGEIPKLAINENSINWPDSNEQ